MDAPEMDAGDYPPARCPSCDDEAGVSTPGGHHEVGTTEGGDWLVECRSCGHSGWPENWNAATAAGFPSGVFTGTAEATGCESRRGGPIPSKSPAFARLRPPSSRPKSVQPI